MDLELKGKKVVVVDCDTQGNASSVFTDYDPDQPGASELLSDGFGLERVLKTEHDRIWLLSADAGLADVGTLTEQELDSFVRNLRRIEAEVDYVLIDTAPTDSDMAVAPLIASDYVFSPVVPDSFALGGAETVFDQVRHVQEEYNPDMKYLGLIINRWNRRNRDHNEVVDALKAEVPEGYLIPQAICERSGIAHVAHSGVPVWKVRSGSARVAKREILNALEWIYNEVEGVE